MEIDYFWMVIAFSGWALFVIAVTSSNAEINRLKSVINALLLSHRNTTQNEDKQC